MYVYIYDIALYRLKKSLPNLIYPQQYGIAFAIKLTLIVCSSYMSPLGLSFLSIEEGNYSKLFLRLFLIQILF